MKNVKDQPKAGDRKTQVRWVNPSWVVTVFVRKENEIGGLVWVVSQEKAFKGAHTKKKADQFAARFKNCSQPSMKSISVAQIKAGDTVLAGYRYRGYLDNLDKKPVYRLQSW